MNKMFCSVSKACVNLKNHSEQLEISKYSFNTKKKKFQKQKYSTKNIQVIFEAYIAPFF